MHRQQDKDQTVLWHLAPGNPGVLSGSWQWMVCIEGVDEKCGSREAGLEGKYCMPKR